MPINLQFQILIKYFFRSMFCSEENWDANGAEDWDTEESKNKQNGIVLFLGKVAEVLLSSRYYPAKVQDADYQILFPPIHEMSCLFSPKGILKKNNFIIKGIKKNDIQQNLLSQVVLSFETLHSHSSIFGSRRFHRIRIA